jgi:hypothetical protein
LDHPAPFRSGDGYNRYKAALKMKTEFLQKIQDYLGQNFAAVVWQPHFAAEDTLEDFIACGQLPEERSSIKVHQAIFYCQFSFTARCKVKEGGTYYPWQLHISS